MASSGDGATAETSAATPRMIGPWTLLRLLGEGGMGRVYLARGERPRREVALKVVRSTAPGLGARLRREIETLARLEHPGIARLYAAGESEVDGVATTWLAMEYVPGTNLIEHAHTAGLPLEARLRLLVELARAVDHAHRRGIVHRDLKPANIIVDPQGRVRVLDFGIARRLEPGDETLTLAGQVLGTLPWMSPEQVGQGEHAVDARSDVYALGVIAYELVGGRLPHPRLATSSLFEAMEILREDAPPLARLSGAARGDLETVVMKALAHEPRQRYASAAAFADDLESVLAHRPVQARRPTLRYRSARFVRRHRTLTVATALVFAALVAATAVSLRFALAEQAAHRQAEQRAEEADAVNAFLQRMLAAASPESAGGEPPTLAAVVRGAEQELAFLDDQPVVQGAVAGTLASTRRALGEYEAALALSERALALSADADPPRRLRLWREHATILIELARFAPAREALDRAAAAWPGADVATQLDLALERTRVDAEEGDVGAAEAGLRALLERIASLPAPLRAQREVADLLATTRSSLSTQLRAAGQLEEAETLARQALAWRRETRGEQAPTTLTSRHNLALILDARGEHAAARDEAEAVVSLQRKVLGEDHAATLTTWQTLANSRIALGELDGAEAAARHSLDGFVRTAGEAHVQSLAAMNSLAYIHEERGELEQAEALYRRVIAIHARTGSRHPSTFAPRNNLAMLLLTAGRAPAAAEELRRLVEDTTAALGPDHLMGAIFRSNHGLALLRAGRAGAAVAELETAQAQLEALLGAEHARTRAAAERLQDARAAAHGEASA